MLNTSAISTAEARFVNKALPSTGPKKIRRVCVYGGSGVCTDPTYRDVAVKLGKLLAQAGVGLVYGGGSEGLMGTLARSVFDAGGEVTAIVTTVGAGRHKFDGLHRLIVVEDAEFRKREMFDASDALVILPGGVETLRNFVDRLMQASLGPEIKPVIVFDIGGFWQPLLALIEHMETSTFMRPDVRHAYEVCRTLDDVLSALAIAVRPNPVSETVSIEARLGAPAPGRPTTLPLHLVDQPSDDGFAVYEVQPG